MKDVQGIQRGKCNHCECIEYRAPGDSSKFPCDYCGHRPVDHVRIVELKECTGKDCDCDKYSSEDPNSYSDCQYCGCSANMHVGSEALRRPKPVATQQHTQPATVPVKTVAGVVPVRQYVTGSHPGGMPQGQSSGIQPRVSSAGVQLLSTAHGTCSYPGCPYPKRVEGTKVHSYCSRSCAQKHSQVQSSFHAQKLASADQAAKSGGHTTSSSSQQIQITTPMGPSSGSGKVCKKCNQRPANPGKSWCETCFRQDQLQRP